MDTMVNKLAVGTLMLAVWMAAVSSRKHDVCLRDTFNATCSGNEVIQMEHARYGLMSVGRCMPHDLGFIGCQEDVLGYMDSLCSGRQSCQLRLQDYLTDGHQPCPVGLESFLSLQYTCIPVFLSTSACAGDPLLVPKSQGILANIITQRTGQGSPACPWEVRGSPGQKVRLTLHDYGVWTPPIPSSGSGGKAAATLLPEGPDICRIYAKVIESGKKNSIPLCGGREREKVIYLSETEGVQITVSDPKHKQHPAYFLLRFEITGCADYIPPEGSVITRHGNTISVNCPDTGNKWRVTCDGTSWISEGKPKDCILSGGKSMSFGALFKSAKTMPQWILIVVILAAAVIIAVPIVVIGIVSFRRRHNPTTQSVHNYKSYPLHSTKEREQMLYKSDRSHKYTREREYTNTAQRHMAVHPGVAPPGEGFPPLPLPPTDSAPNPRNSTLHGPSCLKDDPRDSYHATLKSNNRYKYDSPDAVRRPRSTSDTSGPFYHELEPEHTNYQPNTPQEGNEDDTETLGFESTTPEVLFPLVN